MKILISHAYSNGNKGDAALLSVLISDIRRGFNNPSMTILSLDHIKEGETFEGVPMEHAFMYYARDHYQNKVLQFFYAIFVAKSTLFWALWYKITGCSFPLPKNLKKIVTLYKEADLIIPVGGGYIRAQAGLRNTIGLFFILHPFFFAHMLGKKTIGYSQSIGPFGNGIQTMMAKEAVDTLEGIIVRENISLALLKQWGNTKNVFLSVDSGFSFESNVTMDVRQQLHIPATQMIVGVTVRTWLPTEQQMAYEKVVAQLCDYIIKKYNAVIVFIPQVTVETHADDDRVSSKRTYDYMVHQDQVRLVTEKYDHQTIKAMYADLDYLIGTRFHSVIFGLTSYVPAVAIGYEHKTLGIMTDLGLAEWVVDIKDIDREKTKQLFDALVKEREKYVIHLKQVLPAYIARSEENIFIVKKIYENK